MPRELLVILQGDPGDLTSGRIRHGRRVTQRLSDRVFAIEHPGAAALTELRAVPGALVCERGQVPEQLLAELSDAERLWVRAWDSRREGEKERPGSGLPWDAPGFEPPDPPRRD